MKLLLSLSALALASLAVSFHPSHTPAAPTGAETYELDAEHSSLVFHTKHLGISEIYGRFDKFGDASKATYDATDPSKGSVLLVIAADSVDTNSPARDKHVRSADFFNAKEFPEIIFESKKISGKADVLTVEGELTFHGVKKTVQAKAHVVGQGDTPFGDHRAGFVAELNVSMADFGVEFVKKNPGTVGPDVGLTISIECVRK